MESLKQVLLPKDFEPYLSSYITGGYKEDSSILEKIVIQENSIEGIIRMENYYVSENTNEFHLSVPVAMLWVFQLAIIYSCKDSNLNRKNGEFYMRELTLKCKKEITNTVFTCRLMLTGKKDLGTRMFYKGTISIEDGSFEGMASFIMPK